MDWTYTCPVCGTHLNPNEKDIILLAECSHGKGLFLFSQTPGDYGLTLPAGITVEAGQMWEFFCPVCREDLTSKAEQKIAMIRVTDPEGQDHSVFFSKVAEEHCTFLVNAEGVKIFGPDSIHYDGMIWNKYF